MTTGISALGSYGGLGSAGLYGSYYDPSMMSTMNGLGGYGMSNPMMSGLGGYGMSNPMMSGYGTMGMTGMYNPTQMIEYMKQMYSAQNEIQKMNIQSQVDLHNAKERAQVENLRAHDNAFFDTSMVNGDIQDYIKDIYVNIREGKMDYVAHKYFELRQAVLNKYGDRFSSENGELNNKANVDHFIQTKYSEIGAGLSGDGIKPDLESDILKYGENYAQNGYFSTLFNNKSHTKSTAEETLYKMRGVPIEDKGSKEKARLAGKVAAHVTEPLFAGLIGAVIGAFALTVGKIFTPSWLGKVVSKAPKVGKGIVSAASACGKYGAWIKGGALALAIGDIFWQMTRS